MLTGKTVLVTGAARGIGASIAEEFAGAGAQVALGDIDASRVKETATRLAAKLGLEIGEQVSAHRLDVSVSQEVEAWVEAVMTAWGKIDVVVNNAGIQLNRASLELSDDDWQQVLGVNLDGCFYLCRAAGRHMLARGEGVVINIASIAMHFGMPRRLPYCVSKAGIAALTRVLAAEWASAGVRVNAIAPGYIETELVSYAFEQGHIQPEEITAKIPQGKLAEPRTIGEVALFLASDAAGYITGQTLAVDGGYSIYK